MRNFFSLSSSPDEASFADQPDLDARLFLLYLKMSVVIILNINQPLFIMLQYFSSNFVSLNLFQHKVSGYVQLRGQVNS